MSMYLVFSLSFLMTFFETRNFKIVREEEMKHFHQGLRITILFWHRKSKITARITVGGVVINSASWIVNNALMLPFISAILHSSFIYCAWTFVFSFPFFDWLKRSIRFRINRLSSIISSLINLKTQSSLRVNRSAHSLWPNSS